MITREQQLFINHALPELKRDPRVVGIALAGSYIQKEKMDEFSSLDFVIAISDEEWENVLGDRVEIAERLGTLLSCFTGEHIQSPNQLICLYDNPLIHVNLGFIPLSRVGQRYDNPVVMFEKESLMSEAYWQEPVMTPIPDLQWFEDRFWIWVHFITTRIGRGELFDAIDSISFLRLSVLGPLISMKNGKPAHGVRHIETDSPHDARMLIETVASYDAKSCVRALKAATDMYISLRGMSKGEPFLREKAERAALEYLKRISDRLR
ncbi:MAG: oxalate:formate antiporter [Clostridiales bacterium]|nr:oxalate:formate antiporter [Clostridiales bacterium]